MLSRLRPWFGWEDVVLIVLLSVCYGLCVAFEGSFQFFSVVDSYLGFLLKYFPVAFIVTRVVFVWRARPAPKLAWARKVWDWCGGPLRSRGEVARSDLVALFGIMLLASCLSFYSNVKTRIPFINDAVGDDIFALMDMLVLGESFVPWLEQYVAQRAWLISFLDRVYFHDYQWMVILVLMFWMRGQNREQVWLFKAVGITYLLAVLWTAAYPSYGPFFFDLGEGGARFGWLDGTSTRSSQHYLMSVWIDAQKSMANQTAFVARPFAGIAAFPSLHIGHMVLVATCARRDFPWFAVLVGILTVVTFVATIAFGWHYAVDAVGGVFLGIAVPELVRRSMWRGEPRASDIDLGGSDRAEEE